MVSIVILAAGKGTRMNDMNIPKVCRKVGNIPMISHVIRNCKPLSPKQIIVVVSLENEKIIKETINDKNIKYVIQKDLTGTASAVLAAKDCYKNDDILVLLGDVPLIQTETLNKIVSLNSGCVIMGFEEIEDNKFGRIVLKNNKVNKIVEYNEATEEEKKISLVNSGILYLKNTKLLEQIDNNNSKKEYYLTDIVKFIKPDFVKASREECLGANTPEDLKKLNNLFK